jgi:type IV pilus assembly protein PilC
MARDWNVALHTGQLDAVNEDEAIGALQTRGLFLTWLKRKEAERAQAAKRGAARDTSGMRGRVTVDDKVIFCQQLATLLGAGVPLLKGLEVISAQVDSRALFHAVEQMRQDIEAGKTFRDALAAHPKIFSSFWVNLVETGEASGHLTQSLNQLAHYLESVRDLQRKAITALTYPMVLVGAAVLALSVFVIKIVPVFSEVFSSMNVQIPTLTRVIIAISTFAGRHVFWMIVGAVGIVFAIRAFVRSEEGGWIIDQVTLVIPVIKRLFIQLQLAQFARGLGALLESGVPILFSLEIAQQSATNRFYSRAIGEVKEAVRQGKPMAEPMERTGLFPPMTVQMVQVGEETGELGKMLDRVAKHYEERVDTFIERLSSLFEPIAIAITAVIIGTFVIAMFLPIFQLASTVR